MEERLQKVLAAAGVASRREAEKYILGGRVKVNGKVVKELGTKVDEKCFITVDGKPIKRERKAYYLFYKPRGVVTTMNDPQGRRTVADYVKDLPQRVFPVGRLDYNTEGLLLLTNQGDLVNKIMRAGNYHEKEYLVTVNKPVDGDFVKKMSSGIPILDTITRPCFVKKQGEIFSDYSHPGIEPADPPNV